MKPCARQEGMKETCCRLRCTCMMMVLENQLKFMNIYDYQARRINDKKITFQNLDAIYLQVLSVQN